MIVSSGAKEDCFVEEFGTLRAANSAPETLAVMASRRAARSARNDAAPAPTRQSLRVLRPSSDDSTAERASKVYIVDDNEGIRDSLQRLLQSVDQPVQTFSSAQEFLAGWNGEPDCVLVLDIRMPEMSGLALQKRLEESSSLLPIIFITGHGDVPTAVQAMQHGAFDFIQKPFRSQDLLETIQRALAAASRAAEAEQRRQHEKERISRLTNREHEILELMVQGKPNKVMAAVLGLSQRTVEVHRSSVMKKLQVDSLAAAVRSFLLATGAPEADAASRLEGDDVMKP